MVFTNLPDWKTGNDLVADPLLYFSFSGSFAKMQNIEISLYFNGLSSSFNVLPKNVYPTFCCFTGLAYIDVRNLTKENIRISFDGKPWIMTARQKTDTAVNVPLLKVPQDILKKYEGKLPNGLLLPVLSNQKLNSYLKEIGDLCGISKNITFHLAHHK